MDELQKLEHLSLVAKITDELNNHIGLSDKVLGKLLFYIHIIVQ
jgi:ATP-dependent RNA helicase DHX8/PRP22